MDNGHEDEVELASALERRNDLTTCSNRKKKRIADSGGIIWRGWGLFAV
jgi:hypothetical protein